MPEDIKVQFTFPENPLKNIPTLPFKLPKFTPMQKVTQEQMEKLGIDENSKLISEEKWLLKHIIVLNERSIAFKEGEKGNFKRDYFSDYQIPVVKHKPWVDKNILLLLGHCEEIIKTLKEKIDTRVYEKAQLFYRSWWFCMWKKDGRFRSCKILHNQVTWTEPILPWIMVTMNHISKLEVKQITLFVCLLNSSTDWILRFKHFILFVSYESNPSGQSDHFWWAIPLPDPVHRSLWTKWTIIYSRNIFYFKFRDILSSEACWWIGKQNLLEVSFLVSHKVSTRNQFFRPIWPLMFCFGKWQYLFRL